MSKAVIEEFLAQSSLAIVGVSRDSKKFGRAAFREMKSKGYKVFPVNPHIDSVDNDKCYPDLNALPEKVGGVLIVVPPEEAEKVVKEAASQGIRHIWLQQGSESEKVINLCKDLGMKAVYGECILMFAEPTAFFHKLHRWFRKITGKLPS